MTTPKDTHNQNGDAARELRAQVDRLQRAVDAAAAGTFVWEIKAERILADVQMTRLFGIDPKYANGCEVARFQGVIHRDDIARVWADIDYAIRENIAFETEYRIPDDTGCMRWILSRGRIEYDAAGEAERMVGAVVDITGRKRAEDGLRFLARAGVILGGSLDLEVTLRNVAQFVVDTMADCCYFDIAAEDGDVRRLGFAHKYPEERHKLETVGRFTTKEQRLQHPLAQTLLAGETIFLPSVHDDWLRGISVSDPHYRHLLSIRLRSLLIVPVSADSKIIGALTLCLLGENADRFSESDRHLAEELGRRAGAIIQNALLHRQLQQVGEDLRQINRQKDEFLATLAHELRNPLAPLANAVQIMLRAPDAQMLARAGEMMNRQVRQMTRLIDDLLDVSRIGRGKISLKRERIDLLAAITQSLEATSPLVAECGHEISLDLSPRPLFVDADLVRMTQVFSNLLTNAIKFTPHGGRIRITAAETDGYAVVAIRDNGVGIPADKLAQVFEMFAQVDIGAEHGRGGLGIGLTLVLRLVEMHGGTVCVHSEGTGKGTEFTVKLPLATAVAADKADGAMAESGALRWRRILVVDDNHEVADSLEMLLTMMGVEVCTVYDGASAIALAADWQPEAVFMDIGMPQMDGYETARRMRAQPWCGSTVLIALTGWDPDDGGVRTREAGFNLHLVKPVHSEVIEQLVAGVTEVPPAVTA